MSTLTVGVGQQFSTIAAAVNAAADGDVINVQAGTYTNDFVLDATKSLTLNAVGGQVVMNATEQSPNGKAILTEGGSGITVNINGFTFEGATVPDGNGAGIRYEGGTLNIENSAFFNNQDGILGGADPNGVITIDHSEFGSNGAGDGYTHNIYIGDIASFSLTNSYVHDANVGHEVKSRAENNTITGNVIADNNSTSSYEIDLPNGGNANIANNLIEQGPNSQNPNIIAYGEEGNLHSGTNLSVTGNTIINDQGRGPALMNATNSTATFANNSIYGFGGISLVSGPANQSGTTVLSTRPSFTEAVPSSSASSAVSPVTPPSTPIPTPTSSVTNPPVPSSTSHLVLSLSEDAFQGDAQFTVTVDGQQVGGIYTATVSHAAGATQQFDLGSLHSGQHQIGVTFINDIYAGTPQTDRNLYLDTAYYNGQGISGASAALMSNGTTTLMVTGDQAPVSATTTTSPTATTATPSLVSTTTSSMPVATTTASGIVVDVSEDAYQGDAQYTVTVDGQQIGGIYTASASHGAEATQPVSLGVLAAGLHRVGVTFLNDKWDGTAQTDRNLYVDGATYNGQAVSGSAAALMSNGTDSFTVNVPAAASATTTSSITSASSGLVVDVAEDAWQGDAQFVATVDGKQVGGVYTATALENTGQSQTISLGAVTPGQHQFGITFLNDAYGGTPQTDRNLYVTGASYDGQAIPGIGAALYSAGTANFGFTNSQQVTSNAVVNVSEDAWQGDAQFIISVDGQQVGGTYTATASHSAGQSQAISLSGIPENFQSHDIAVTFLNDAYAGTPQTDRNLYVNSIQFDGQSVGGISANLYSAGTQHFTTWAPQTWTG